MTKAVLLALAQTQPEKSDTNLVDLVIKSSGPVFAILLLLMFMALASWIIAILKAIQVSRMRAGLHRFEKEVFNFIDAKDLFGVAQRNGDSPGGRVVLALSRRGGSAKVLESIGKRAIVDEQQRAGTGMTVLASIAASAPFIGLFGTVWGILLTFLRITEKTTTMDLVGPIGEALIATAVGLFAAIPALIFYNLLNRRLDDLVSELEAATDAWVTLVAESDQKLSIPPDRAGAQSRPAGSHPAGQAPGAYGGYAGG